MRHVSAVHYASLHEVFLSFLLVNAHKAWQPGRLLCFQLSSARLTSWILRAESNGGGNAKLVVVVRGGGESERQLGLQV